MSKESKWGNRVTTIVIIPAWVMSFNAHWGLFVLLSLGIICGISNEMDWY